MDAAATPGLTRPVRRRSDGQGQPDAAAGPASATGASAGLEDGEGEEGEGEGEEDDGAEGEGGGGEGEEEEEEADEGRGESAEAEAEEWDEIFASPLSVRFTQDKIHPFFYRRGPIVNVVPKIRPVFREVEGATHHEEAVVELVPPFSPIHCLRKGEELWSLDNRRLYALQLAAMEHWPQRCQTRVLVRDRLPRHKFKTQYRKFNTTSEGRTISVCARYQQFDTWSWFDRAVELEWYTFSQRLGALLSVFEVLPVIGALLFRTGLTGFDTRIPLVVGFVLSFSLDFLRQKVPAFERRLCEIHVRLVVDGEVGPPSAVWQRLRALLQRLTSAEETDAGPMSAPQLAASMAVALALLLPYVLGMARARLRSSLMSCWLGVACVLVAQVCAGIRSSLSAAANAESARRLSPKGRD